MRGSVESSGAERLLLWGRRWCINCKCMKSSCFWERESELARERERERERDGLQAIGLGVVLIIGWFWKSKLAEWNDDGGNGHISFLQPFPTFLLLSHKVAHALHQARFLPTLLRLSFKAFIPFLSKVERDSFICSHFDYRNKKKYLKNLLILSEIIKISVWLLTFYFNKNV